ncbi:WRC-like protein, partial [Tanacetum coccineum]
MDTEPGRCRRTDGRKWRCRSAVIPDQKYCLRHMHRGCNRSRKPVEVLKTELVSTNSTTTSSICSLKATPIRQSVTGGNAKNQNKVQINDHSYKIKKHSTENVVSHLESSLLPESVQHCNDQEGYFLSLLTAPQLIRTTATRNRESISKEVLTLLPFTSVAKQCGASSNIHTSVFAVNDSERCRRTDGKKWRCSKTVLPEQKYCEQHMRRGAKKDDHRQYLNTSMSFSVGGSYQQMGDEGKQSNDDSSSSSSSDGNNGSDSNGATSSSDSPPSLCERYLETTSYSTLLADLIRYLLLSAFWSFVSVLFTMQNVDSLR